MKSFFLLMCMMFLTLFVSAQDVGRSQANQKRTEANQAYQSGNFQRAIELVTEEIEIRKKNKHSFGEIGEAVFMLGNFYAANKDFDTAIQTTFEARNYFNNMRPVIKPNVAACNSSISSYYYQRGEKGDLQEAIKYGEEALKDMKKGNANYVETASLLIMYYTETNSKDKAAALSTNILKMGKSVYGANSIEYANLLSSQAYRLYEEGNVTQAIQYADECIEIHRAQSDTTSVQFARLLLNAASYHSSNEEYSKSLTLLETAQKLMKANGMEGTKYYMQCKEDLLSAYAKLGDLEKSNSIAVSMMRDGESGKVKNGSSLTKQAQIYANNGNFSEAINLSRKAIEDFESADDTISLINAYINLSGYLHSYNKTDEAIKTCNNALKILEKRNDRMDLLARAYTNKSAFCRAEGERDDALIYANKAIECFKLHGDTLNTNYASVLGNVSVLYADMKDMKMAIDCSMRSYAVKKQLLGEHHPDNALTLYNLANYYYNNGDIKNMQSYYHQALNFQSEIVRSNFSHMTMNGRESYWNTKKYLYTMAPVFVFNAADTDSLILQDAYNVQLFTKGILLNSEIDFKQLLSKSGSSKLTDLYDKLIKLNRMADELYSKMTAESSQEALSYRRQATVVEHELMRASREYGDYTSNMAINMSMVSAGMNDDDVAVEIVEVPTTNEGVHYFALYLRKGWTTPKKVHMVSLKNLETLKYGGMNFYKMCRKKDGINYLFNDPKVGQLVWGKLMEAWANDKDMPPVRNVYFSPVGIFYKLGVEYLKISESSRICDLFEMHRVSSTKQLASKSIKSQSVQNATVFGGVNFDMDVDEMKNRHDTALIDYKKTYMTSDVENNRTMQSDVAMVDNEIRSLFGDDDDEEDDENDTESVRAGVHYLPGTLDEAQQIAEELLQKDIPTNVVLADDATEENVKGLSGSNQSVVHIATHGFSFPEGSKSRKALAVLLGKKNTTELNPMHFSGLLFAGSNNMFKKHIKIPSNIEDGVLTAAEISVMDLRNVDMIVMSACQTGLGDVKDDGVFGLQRGFKKAGVHTLLMSMWSVSDRATQIMMNGFYAALTQGYNRHQALAMAQQKVIKSGYIEPYYWASFIILDDD